MTVMTSIQRSERKRAGNRLAASMVDMGREEHAKYQSNKSNKRTNKQRAPTSIFFVSFRSLYIRAKRVQ